MSVQKTKFENLGLTLFIFGLFFLLSSIVFFGIFESEQAYAIKKVPCYDSYNNKINGVLCDKKVPINNKEFLISNLNFIFFVSFIYGAALIIGGSIILFVLALKEKLGIQKKISKKQRRILK